MLWILVAINVGPINSSNSAKIDSTTNFVDYQYDINSPPGFDQGWIHTAK